MDVKSNFGSFQKITIQTLLNLQRTFLHYSVIIINFYGGYRWEHYTEKLFFQLRLPTQPTPSLQLFRVLGLGPWCCPVPNHQPLGLRLQKDSRPITS